MRSGTLNGWEHGAMATRSLCSCFMVARLVVAVVVHPHQGWMQDVRSLWSLVHPVKTHVSRLQISVQPVNDATAKAIVLNETVVLFCVPTSTVKWTTSATINPSNL